MAITKSFIYIEPMKSFYRKKQISNETKDWNDFKLVKDDRTRIGFGEHGLKTFSEGDPSEAENKLFDENGHNAMISDMISLDRSVPDLRIVE